MWSFGWSPLILLFPSPPVPFIILVTVPKAPIANGINVTFMFHTFSIPYQRPATYPSFHFLYNNNNNNNNNYDNNFRVFHTSVSGWSLSDSKFPQVFRTLLCILAHLNNDVLPVTIFCWLYRVHQSQLLSLSLKFPKPF